LMWRELVQSNFEMLYVAITDGTSHLARRVQREPCWNQPLPTSIYMHHPMPPQGRSIFRLGSRTLIRPWEFRRPYVHLIKSPGQKLSAGIPNIHKVRSHLETSPSTLRHR
jgi:hypothetical protein